MESLAQTQTNGEGADTGRVTFDGRLRIAICGHVDTRGAPTGRLIFELQSLSECELDHLEQEALELHKSREGFFGTFCHSYHNWLDKDYERARTNASTRKSSVLTSHTTPSLKMALACCKEALQAHCLQEVTRMVLASAAARQVAAIERKAATGRYGHGS